MGVGFVSLFLGFAHLQSLNMKHHNSRALWDMTGNVVEQKNVSLSAWGMGEVLQGSVKFAKLQYAMCWAGGWGVGKGDPWEGREGD